MLRGHGRSHAIWAVKRRPQNANALLYRFPAPNVHGNGAICNGSATFPQASLATIDTALDTFFTSAFNDHLAGDVVHGGNLLDLWRSLHMQRALADKQAPANEQITHESAQKPDSNRRHHIPKALRFPTDRLIRAGRLKEIL
ncbi:MAG: prokaryotic E2 ligase family D protein [Anaerolineae bacterium]|nr:prokaryotic E2 ligase family D protein [Anaerolineae bacterium]